MKDRSTKISQSEVDIPSLPSTDITPELHWLSVIPTVSQLVRPRSKLRLGLTRRASLEVTIPKPSVMLKKELEVYRVLLRVVLRFHGAKLWLTLSARRVQHRTFVTPLSRNTLPETGWLFFSWKNLAACLAVVPSTWHFSECDLPVICLYEQRLYEQGLTRAAIFCRSYRQPVKQVNLKYKPCCIPPVSARIQDRRRPRDCTMHGAYILSWT